MKKLESCMRFKACVNKMGNLGKEVKNEVVVMKVIRTLIPKWNHVTIIIEESKNFLYLQTLKRNILQLKKVNLVQMAKEMSKTKVEGEVDIYRRKRKRKRK